jgi:dTDP-4-amino-4,6-dideoxygalactose transaminase
MAKLAINGGTRVRTQDPLPWPRATAEDEQAVLDALRDAQWCRISADRAHEFERKFADFQGARYGISLNSGTSALELGLLAMGIPPGGEVIVSPYTFMASVTSILVTRGVPVFVDIDPDTYNIDPDLIEAAITDRTFAIMAVHFGGRACDMQPILDIAKKHDLKVIEDASHSHGATWNHQGLGCVGDVGAVSLGSGKNLSAGEGGILLTNDEEIYWNAAQLHDLWTGGLVQRSGDTGGGSFIAGKDWTFPQVAPNYRLSEILAALLTSGLTRLEEETQIRADNGRYLDDLLEVGPLTKILRRDAYVTRNSHHIYTFKYNAGAFDGLPRGKFVEAMAAEGIPVNIAYPRGCHKQPVFHEYKDSTAWPYNRFPVDSNIDYAAVECPVTDYMCANETVWLSGSYMLDAGREGMHQVAEAVDKIAANRAELMGAVAAG